MWQRLNWDKPTLLPHDSPIVCWLVLAAVILSNICAISSGIGLIIADSSIQGSLAIGDEANMWLGISFFLVVASTVPVADWLANHYGYKKLFFLGNVIFFTSSYFSGHAESYGPMMFFRFISALGAGSIFPLSLTLVGLAFNDRLRTFAIAIYVGASFGIGTALGSFLGGYLAEFLSWRYLFTGFITVSPLVFLPVWLFVEETKKIREGSFDYAGVIFYLVTIASGVTFFSNVKAPWNTDGVSSPLCSVTLVLFVIFLFLFLTRELMAKEPLLLIKLLLKRPFFLGNLALFIVATTLFSTTASLTDYMERALGYSKYQAGIYQLPLGIVLGICGAFSGLFGPIIGIRLLSMTGLAILTFSCFFNHTVDIQSDHSHFFWLQVVRGMGLGLSLGPLTAFSLSRIDKSQLGRGAVIVTLSRQLGGSLGALWVSFIREIRYPYHLLRFGEQVMPQGAAWQEHMRALEQHLVLQAGSAPVNSMQHSPDTTKRAFHLFADYTSAQATILSINDAYWLIGWGALILLVIISTLMMRAYLRQRRQA